jgi:hypothetical protein
MTRAVSRELEKELKRHGVTWAMEKQSDGSTTFHVQGADIELVQHALGVAAERVDERLVRRGGDRQEQPRDLVDDTAVPTHGSDELREDAPEQNVVDANADRSVDDVTRPVDEPDRQPAAVVEQDGAVTDRGGHSEQRDPRRVARSRRRRSAGAIRPAAATPIGSTRRSPRRRPSCRPTRRARRSAHHDATQPTRRVRLGG